MEVKVKYFDDALTKLSPIQNGDWIDLRACETVELHEGDYVKIPLGIAMQLPEGYEALILPRSSTFERYGVICVNSMGVIDNSYCGDNDEWKFPVLATRRATIPKGERICQFRIVANQPQLILSEVEHLHNADRGRFGSTGRR